jgi:hypothetical protein
MGRRGDDVAFDAFLTEPRGRKIGKTRIRVPGYARNPKDDGDLAGRMAAWKARKVYAKKKGREFAEPKPVAMVPMSFEEAQARREAAIDRLRFGGRGRGRGREMTQAEWERYLLRAELRRNPEVWLDWQQRGHTMRDPTGRSLHTGRALWRKGLSKRGAKREAAAARKYARRQKDWTKYGVTVKRNPRRQKFGSGSVFPLRSFGVWMSGGKTRTVKAHTANEAAAKAAGGPVIGTGGSPMGPMHFTSKGGRGNSIKVWPRSESGNPMRRKRRNQKRGVTKRRKMSRLVKRRPRNSKGQFVKRNRAKRR